MLLGLAIYLTGRRYFPQETPRRTEHKHASPVLTAAEIKTIAVLILLLPVLAVSACSNQEIFNAYLLWAERHADLRAFGHAIPTTWLITLDSIVSVSALAGSIAFWQTWAKKRHEPDELTKLVLGCAISTCGVLCLVAAAAQSAATGAKASLLACGLPCAQRHRLCQCIPCVAGAVFAGSAPGAGIDGHRDLLSLSVWRQPFRRLARRPAGKDACHQFPGCCAGLVAAAGVTFLLVRPFFRKALAWHCTREPAAQ